MSGAPSRVAYKGLYEERHEGRSCGSGMHQLTREFANGIPRVMDHGLLVSGMDVYDCNRILNGRPTYDTRDVLGVALLSASRHVARNYEGGSPPPALSFPPFALPPPLP